MRTLFLFVSCIYLYCCNSTSEKTLKEQGLFNKAIVSKNDTFCFSKQVELKSNRIKLLDACHIIYNDSLSEQISIEFGNGELPTEYNFDKESTELEYRVSNDTIIVKLLLMVKSRNIRLMPDAIYWDNDTVCLKEKAEKISTDNHLQNFKFEEFKYRFLIKEKNDTFYFRHIK